MKIRLFKDGGMKIVDGEARIAALKADGWMEENECQSLDESGVQEKRRGRPAKAKEEYSEPKEE